MDSKLNITKACREALKIMAGITCPAHSVEHVVRVYDWSRRLAENYPNTNLNVLKIAAYWHDVGRAKQAKDKDNHAIKSAEMAEKYLLRQGASKNFIKNVKEAIVNHSSQNKPTTIEGKIIHDADKLAFIYGHENLDIFDGFKDGFKTKTYTNESSIRALKKLTDRSAGETFIYRILILPEAKKIYKQKEKNFLKSVEKVLELNRRFKIS